MLAAATSASGCLSGLWTPDEARPHHLVVEEEPADPRESLHLRLLTDRGPVHVIRPVGYDAATAGMLLYVHGYYTDLDGAFRNQKLATQFDASSVNALFVSPEAPGEVTEPVRWSSLKELLETVRASGQELPRGAVVAMAHSGGFRTLVPWLNSGLLDSVVLLDGLYGGEQAFAAWVDDGSQRHQLVLVGSDTASRIERFVAGRDDVERALLPLSEAEASQPGARLVYLRATAGHMELVTEGKAIPEVLRLTPLPKLNPG